MNEFKGTPGPWDASFATMDGTPVGNEAYVSKHGGSIATVRAYAMLGSDEQMREVAMKDAQMMSASPALFKAVNDFLNHFEGDIPLWLFEEAEAAVAKALGK